MSFEYVEKYFVHWHLFSGTRTGNCFPTPPNFETAPEQLSTTFIHFNAASNSVHDMVVVRIVGNSIFRCRMYYTTFGKKSSEIRHRHMFIIFCKLIYNDDHTKIQQKTEIKVCYLCFFYINLSYTGDNDFILGFFFKKSLEKGQSN